MIKEEMNDANANNTNVGFLGEYLKQKRLDKNFSLEKLSQKTKISVNILKSLEANDYDHLPSAAYIKGFVTSYSKVLGLSLDEAINKMEYTYLNVLGKPFPALNHTKTMNLAKPQGAREMEPSPHDVIENSDSIMENTKSILPILIFAGVILLFIGGYKIISSVIESEVNSQKPKDLGPKIETSAALVPTFKKDAPVPVPATAATTEAAKESAPVAPAVEEPKKVEAKPDFQRNFPTVEFKKVKGKLFTVKTDAPENSTLPERVRNAMNPELQNIYIKAVEGNTWMSYKIDERPIESVIISKDMDLFLQGNEIRIFLGNVNVTRIFYNNYLLDTPTKNGVKSLIFPEESNEKFQMPLFPKAKDDILYTSEDYIKRMKLEEDELAKRAVGNP